MILANKYEILEKLGDGRFGIVYRGVHVKTDVLVAIKIETSTTLCLLKHETTLLKYLADQGVRRYIPQVHWFGIIHGHAFLVIPFYEPLTNTSVNADKWMRQAVDILESIHSKHVVHRDIKPENFMQKDDHLVLIDFGLATFIDPDIMADEPQIKKEHLIGTPKFASWFVHDGQEYTKRDDLLSVLYMALWIYHGDHLWEYDRTEYKADPYENIMLPSTHVLKPMNILLKRTKTKDRIIQLCVNTGNDNLVRMADTLYENHIEYSYCLFS